MTRPETPDGTGRAARLVLWAPGLLVALGAAVATAHGLYEVARAADTPPVIAGLYPLITDGLALVAYAATARLAGRGRRYAWTVVVLAAGLSGLAQASYLAHGAVSTSTVLRFGIGAWPAVAAAIVAHLLFLIAHAHRAATTGADSPHPSTEPVTGTPGAADSVAVTTGREEPDARASTPAASGVPGAPSSEAPSANATVHRDPVQLAPSKSVQPEVVQPPFNATELDTVQPSTVVQPEPVQPQPPSPSVQPSQARAGSSPARARADRTARAYAARHGSLPTVTALVDAAEVSRGTAATALKALRDEPQSLHVVYEQVPSEANQ